MYRRLSEYRGKFIEVLQHHPAGRLYYIGKLVALDQDVAELQLYDAAGIPESCALIPLNTMVGVLVNTADSLEVEARVMGRNEDVETLRRMYAQEVNP